MFIESCKAHIPIVGVHTDDLVTFEQEFRKLLGSTPFYIATTSKIPTQQVCKYLYTEYDGKLLVSAYKELVKSGRTLIVINPKPDDLVLDVGSMPISKELITEHLLNSSGVKPEYLNEVLGELKGLHLKRVSELMAITDYVYGDLKKETVRNVRQRLLTPPHGIRKIDTVLQFHKPDKQLVSWVSLNKEYFLNTSGKCPKILIPRGILLDGPPGVGKSTSAMYLANALEVPLYRLDLSSSLSKYVGESEARTAAALFSVEKEEPCVLLIDEVEKVFQTKGDSSGPIDRILSQLLWWLQSHDSRVLTVMTTNDYAAIPPELYRPGRIDVTITLEEMSYAEAKEFIFELYTSIMAKIYEPPLIKEEKHKKYSHAWCVQFVVDAIKKEGSFKNNN